MHPVPRTKAQGRDTETGPCASQRVRKGGVQSLDQIDDEEFAKINGIAKITVGRSRSAPNESPGSSTSDASSSDL
jgi:hypothetical protein